MDSHTRSTPMYKSNRLYKAVAIYFFSGSALIIPISSSHADTSSFCTSPPEKPYTPNRTLIEAKIQKLEGFERDMRATVNDLQRHAEEDAENLLMGRLYGYKTLISEVEKAICATANLATENSKVYDGWKIYAKACRLGEDIGGKINDLVDCAMKGDCVASAIDMRNAKKSRLDVSAKQLAKEKVRENTGRTIKKTKKVGEALSEAEMVEAGNAGCSLSSLKDACALGTAIYNGAKTLEGIEGLNEATEDNRIRQAKVMDLLNVKIQATAEKIKSLRSAIEPWDWQVLTQPKPIMTPLNNRDCKQQEVLTLPKMTLLDHQEKASEISSQHLQEDEQEGFKPDYEQTLSAIFDGTTKAIQRYSENQRRLRQQQANPPPKAASPSSRNSGPTAQGADRKRDESTCSDRGTC